LAIKSSRLLKSLCWRISATSAFSSILRTPFKRAISASVPLCARVAAGLVSVFCPSHVLGNLLHEGQTLSKRDQSRIRRGVDLAHVSRAKRDQRGIYLVVLRALQVKLRIGAHLRGLEHNHHKTPSAQLRHHLTLISAARLNTYALDPMLAQPPRESSVTLGIIVNLQPQPARERHFELAFAGINLATQHVMLVHLRRPFLVMRTHGSFNHPGPMKKANRDLATAISPSRLGRVTIRRSAARLGRPPGPGRSS